MDDRPKWAIEGTTCVVKRRLIFPFFRCVRALEGELIVDTRRWLLGFLKNRGRTNRELGRCALASFQGANNRFNYTLVVDGFRKVSSFFLLLSEKWY